MYHIAYSKSNNSFIYCKFFFIFQTELSHGLQSLSEKAKAGTEFIQRLKGMSEKVHVSKISIETFLKLTLSVEQTTLA